MKREIGILKKTEETFKTMREQDAKILYKLLSGKYKIGVSSNEDGDIVKMSFIEFCTFLYDNGYTYDDMI